jgi:hypothetical protein
METLRYFFVIRKLRKLIYVSNMSTVTYVSEHFVTHVPGLYNPPEIGGKLSFFYSLALFSVDGSMGRRVMSKLFPIYTFTHLLFHSW